jgi:hypothetical protein
MPRKRGQKTSKKKTISIPSMKEWIMPPFWLINKPPNSKLFKKFKWDSTFLKHGTIPLTRYIITTVSACTFVNSALPFST